MIFQPLASSSHGNAYLLDDGASRLLIECGIPYRRLQKLLGFDTAQLAGCLISHEHKDHSHCCLDLIKNGIPVHASEGTAEALGCQLLTPICRETERSDRYEAFSVGSYDVLAFPTYHDAAEPLGYLVRSRADGEKLLFATDTVSLRWQFQGLNIVAIECNYSTEILDRSERLPDKVRHRIKNSHMEISAACAFLQKLDRSLVRQVFLLHLSDACSNEGIFVDLAERVCPGIEVIACPK